MSRIPSTTSLFPGFDSSMVSEESILRVEKEKAEEVSLLSDNENNERYIMVIMGTFIFPNT